MKRYLFLAFLMTITLTSMAASPKLASAKIFDDLDHYDPTLSITIVERKDQTVRSVMFKNKPDLLKKIQKALASDKEKADKKSLMTNDGEISESVVINDKDKEIKIGLTTSKSKEVYFFIKISPKNNYNNPKRTSSNTRTKKTTRRKNRSAKTERSENLNDFESLDYFNDFNELSSFSEFSSSTF